ncbi:MAG: hypothetical protein D6797_08765 [Bdellovibrio sp.]|nr:MAG: hypothetical protein D6797_08765 [Bdellovibrio sp.]
MKNLSLFLFFLIFSLFIFIVYDNFEYQNQTPAERLNLLWKEDIQHLREQGKLPKIWSKIKSITVQGDKKTTPWIPHLKAPVRVNKNGSHKLNVFISYWENQKEAGTLFIHQLINLKNQNLEWELMRTYLLPKPAPTKKPKSSHIKTENK